MKTFNSSNFQKEAKEKWGKTQAFREYEEKHHSKQTKDTLAAEMDQIMAAFALCMEQGEKPDAEKAQSLVKLLQTHICESYYQCTNEILAGLGQMYVADERFKNNIDRHAEGTAAYVCKAIEDYCRK